MTIAPPRFRMRMDLVKSLLPKYARGPSLEIGVGAGHFLAHLAEKGYEVTEPDGTFYLFPRTPGGDDEAFVGKAIEDLLLLVPGQTFGREGHFRMAYCVSDQTVDLAIEKLPPASTFV